MDTAEIAIPIKSKIDPIRGETNRKTTTPIIVISIPIITNHFKVGFVAMNALP
jgi:hypothetical protein